MWVVQLFMCVNLRLRNKSNLPNLPISLVWWLALCGFCCALDCVHSWFDTFQITGLRVYHPWSKLCGRLGLLWIHSRVRRQRWFLYWYGVGVLLLLVDKGHRELLKSYVGAWFYRRQDTDRYLHVDGLLRQLWACLLPRGFRRIRNRCGDPGGLVKVIFIKFFGSIEHKISSYSH